MRQDLTDVSSESNSRVEEHRNLIEQRLEEYLKNPEGIFLIKTPCGSGKSTISQKVLKKLDIRNSITLVPNHRNAKQIIQDNWSVEKEKPIHLKGKAHACLRIEEDEVKDLREETNGQIPQWFCEDCCYYKKECSYHSDLEAVYKGTGCVGVHPQLDSSLHNVMQNEDRPFILDESIMNALIHAGKVPIGRINGILPSLNAYPTLSHICNVLLEKKNDGNNSDRELLDALRSGFNDEWKSCYAYFRKLKDNDKDSGINGLIVLSFISMLQKHAEDNSDCTELSYFKKQSDGESILYYETISKIPRRKKTIIMSATMNLEIMKKLFPNDAEYSKPLDIHPPLTPNVNLFQLGGEQKLFEKEGKEPRLYWTNSLPRTSLIKGKKPTALLIDYAFKIKQICPQHDNILIVCHKKVRSYLEKSIRLPNVSIEHYGAVEGLNKYNHYDCAILLGTPFLPDDVVKRWCRKLGVGFNTLMRNLVEERMIQAYERIRPRITTDPKTIIVLSSYPEFKDDNPIPLTKSELSDRFGCISVKERIKQVDLVYSLCMNENSMGVTELRNKVDGDNNRKKKLISHLKDEGIFISSTVRVPPKNRKELLSIPPEHYKQITMFPTSVRKTKLLNSHIIEHFNQISESDPPDYPQSYYEEIYKNRLSDILPFTISELLGLSVI